MKDTFKAHSTKGRAASSFQKVTNVKHHKIRSYLGVFKRQHIIGFTAKHHNLWYISLASGATSVILHMSLLAQLETLWTQKKVI